MGILELCARAKHLKSLLSSSSSLALLRPPYAALRHGPSETLVHFAHPCRGLSSLAGGSETTRALPCRKVQESHISEKQSLFIPVKAYFLCTRIDLKSLQTRNLSNVVMPHITSEYIILRYYDVEIDAEFMKTDFASESSCHYMLVFHYGSVVLFNVSDPEVDNYLKIVVEHASGLLPEMRKNG
ncbi:protein RETARDED ROOT GROWTH, mitochondrial-like [Zingiber officinale]|uniref:protein RETARDED ROOT GROWTH, mitochondrial-like n=1 Tax=Zingiber officinale TaxID=94328 RepID=UPI001C4C4A73|nr:protein RETARDED ROOT GROWTH, mitochondrial-like [Zingiber officinale]